MPLTHTPSPPPDAPQGQQHLPPGVYQHEGSDASATLVFTVAFCLLGGIVMVALIAWGFLWSLGYYARWGYPPAPPPADVRPQQPPEPRLQVNEASDLAAIRNAENAHIAFYGWVDKSSGIVRIPIARAMELAVQRGLPDFVTEQKAGEKEAPKVPWKGRQEYPVQEPRKTNVK